MGAKARSPVPCLVAGKVQCMTAPKLSNLTEQDKIQLAAELDGGERDGCEFDQFRWKRGTETYVGDFNYFTSYDAIIPLIQKQDYGVQEAIWTSTKNIWWGLTPSQLLDALLIATGKATI